VTIPFTRPELWAWADRTGFTSAVLEVHTDRGIDGLGEAVVVLGPTPAILMAIPTGPGLGLELDRTRLDEYHAAYERQGFASAHAGQGANQMMNVPNQ
jgi:L-alanine-DL-glutamate epimerase-like enolase superfamily enzyme